jgi:ATP-dependent exoDNAse (exonuclease V) beta subunit
VAAAERQEWGSSGVGPTAPWAASEPPSAATAGTLPTAPLALADRERELYVAMTRAKQRLTILHDPADTRPMSALNPALATLFAAAPSRTLPGGISERRWQP